jgi:restriction system protein
MSRRRQGGVVDALMELTSSVPWWAGVLLAIAAYLGLQVLAAQQVPIAKTPDRIASTMSAQILKSFAFFAQYLLPVVLLAGAVVSAMKQYKRKTPVATVRRGTDAGVLNEMSWREFETLVAESFRLKGYAVTELGGPSAHGGVDLVLHKGTEEALVQCKQWRAFKVSVKTIRELYGVMAAEGAAAGFVVTSGEFTADAIEFARGRNIELIDGAHLLAMLDEVRNVNRPTAKGGEFSAAPSCPRCGKNMVRRVAKQAAGAGAPFWGCTAFPACRGTRTIA